MTSPINISQKSSFGAEEELATKIAALNINETPRSPNEVLLRCQRLLDELKTFSDYCKAQKYNGDYRQTPEYNHFRSDIQGEVKSMEKLKSDPDLPPERTSQLVNASNLTYWEALWDAAKRTQQISVLRRHGSPVDIISENGTCWTKVSTVTERRLLMEMAKQGWDWQGSDTESDDETYGSSSRNDDDLDISLVKMAVTLRDLARKSRIRYRIPKIHFILTRITRGNKEIDFILDKISGTGAIVHTADELTPAPPIEDVLEVLAINEFANFTPTLNVDCTLLLAVVSDISHGQVKEEPWFNRNVRNQIKIEETEQLMPRSLWPAMGDHDLVCTKLAAQRMREIVSMIGTPTEKQRMAIMMGDDAGRISEQLLEDFRAMTVHDVPGHWKLPIRVIDEKAVEKEKGTMFHKDVMKKLVDVNRSVFMYGWLSGHTTISSNRVATKTLEKSVEEFRTSEEQRGPDVWICPTARSLVAKEKNRPYPSQSKQKREAS